MIALTKTKKALMIGSLVLTMLAPSIASAEVGKTNKDYEKLYGPESGSHRFLSESEIKERLQTEGDIEIQASYGKILWSAEYVVNSFYVIPKAVYVASATNNNIRILSDAQKNTGSNSTYDIELVEWNDWANGWAVVQEVEMRIGSKQYEYFEDLDDDVDYRLRVVGNVKGIVTVYQQTR